MPSKTSGDISLNGNGINGEVVTPDGGSIARQGCPGRNSVATSIATQYKWTKQLNNIVM